MEEFSEFIAGAQPIEKRPTVSAGIVVFPRHGTTPQELREKVEETLKMAEISGGNTIQVAKD